jgi:hypothetical protein
MRKTVFNLLVCFLLLYLSTILRAKSFPEQDPLVERALSLAWENGIELRTREGWFWSLRLDTDYWKLVGELKELERKAVSADSKAVICWLIAKYSFPLVDRVGWKNISSRYAENLRKSGIVYPHEALYDPIIRSYLRFTGRWGNMFDKDKKDLEKLISEVKEELYNHYREYMRKAESYNPDITLFVIKTIDDRIYYNIHIKTQEEFESWSMNIEELERERFEKELKQKILSGEIKSPPGSERDWAKAIAHLRENGVFGIALKDALSPYVSFLWDDLADYYAWDGDYDRAIYYKECREAIAPYEIGYYVTMMPSLQGHGETSDKLRELRAESLKKLRLINSEDRLHPFIYINNRPFKPKKGFTKGGKPFVSADSFLKALNIPFEWTREGKLLTIKKDEGAVKIANIKDKWWIYKDGERKEVEGYIKDKELYLPLKKLCELLNLKLEWDDDTFIGKVFTK